ncbi:hypothetical protein Tco_0448926 [Tanacetum coccineum]
MFVISLDSSHNSSINAFGAEGDFVTRSVVIPPVMIKAVVTSHAVNAPFVLETGTKVTTLVHASIFYDSDSIETVKADDASPSYSAKQDLSMGSWELNAETLHQVFVPERKRLESECEKQDDLLKARDEEVKNLKAQLLLKETKATEAARLCVQDLKLKDLNVVVSSLRSQKHSLVDQVHALETTCSGLCDQVAKLDTNLLEMAFHLEEKFYPHLFTTIYGRRWLLTHGLKLAVVKCLNYQEYLSALGARISRAIKKGMQDGLSAGIDHGKAGRSLSDVVAYNPAVEADYNFALQRLHEVDFPLLAELKSHKDASTTDVMNQLCLEGPLADAPRISDLKPDVEQLTLPINRPEDQMVLGKASTSSSAPAAIVTMTTLLTNFAAASSVPPITIEDYEIVGTDGTKDAQGNGQGNVAAFPTVDFEK